MHNDNEWGWEPRKPDWVDWILILLASAFFAGAIIKLIQ